MQGKFRRQFLFAGVAERLEPLCQLQVQLRTSDLGKSPIQNFPIKRMPEFIMRRNLAVRQLVNSGVLDELLSFGESLASIFDAAGVDFVRVSNGYYSFTDAWIAMAYKSLTKEQQARLDPMITGFNPADMYAADHIRRVLQTFPGVFTGIGEFTVHKEFVSAKIRGEVASLENPALDRILGFGAEVGLAVLIHNDIDVPFAKEGSEPAYLNQIKALFKRHPNVTIIWAHMGLGRVVRPGKNHAAQIEEILRDPDFRNV